MRHEESGKRNKREKEREAEWRKMWQSSRKGRGWGKRMQRNRERTNKRLQMMKVKFSIIQYITDFQLNKTKERQSLQRPLVGVSGVRWGGGR